MTKGNPVHHGPRARPRQRSAIGQNDSSKRACKLGQKLPYTLERFRAYVESGLEVDVCHYCAGPIHAGNWSADHFQPVSRGGSGELTNIYLCCRRCNLAKGPLNGQEYLALLRMLAGWPTEAMRDVIARLKAGGKANKGK